MQISLVDFRTATRRYELDVDSSHVSHREFASEREAQAGARGLAAQVRVGLRSRALEFFAFYIYGQRIFLYGGGRPFELTNRATQVKRSTVLPFVKKFSVSQAGKEIASWTYWFTDLVEDGFDARDFLSYIAREIAPEPNHAKFIHFWEEAASGRDPARASFQEDLRKILQSTEENVGSR